MLEMLGFAVKRFRQTRRSLSAVSLLFAACTISVLQAQQSALSQSSGAIAPKPSDLICYMQNSNGSVINLSRFCAEDSNTVAVSTTDQRFLELYQRSLEKRSSGSQSTQAALTQAQQNPRSVIERAQAVCTALISGQSQPQTFGQVGRDPIETTALEYYCPELGE
ncbi:MAG: hypothetical protein LH702_27030 [Phormidesmis sp. CAN_BIN44]|nr:hypothetical protein [Phormidesmis sp. CAN_BIN44]